MKIGIIGGGASGMAAAITALSEGAAVTVYEKNDRIGKKILATGNGKCNLSNTALTCGCYRSEEPQYLAPILKQVTVPDTLAFFHRLGLMTKDKNGCLYPECEQASAVLDVLRFALSRLGAVVKTGAVVTRLEADGGRFLVHTKKDNGHSAEVFDKIILACGSKAGLSQESSENGLKLAASFGLACVPFTPALVQLRCKEPFMKALAGVRAQASVSLTAGGVEYSEIGELQLTDYGISGIPVFQLSRYAAKALHKGEKQLSVSINFLPQLSCQEWKKELLMRKKLLAGESAEQFFTGTIHKKAAAVILKECGIPFTQRMDTLPEEKLLAAGRMFQRFPLTVTAANPFINAQVCAGGVRLSEVTEKLEAKKQKGMYLTGELLDADGRCGGYNLQWAWTTGIIAGHAAAKA
ncbi:MAG: aminoacetone oxidase family FAD-binding enzyme [Lachnospiraceae bacterium]|nr:aminoacetone oxidase family FAD-binding enzyme [Lachnospiraceae bacterium]